MQAEGQRNPDVFGSRDVGLSRQRKLPNLEQKREMKDGCRECLP